MAWSARRVAGLWALFWAAPIARAFQPVYLGGPLARSCVHSAPRSAASSVYLARRGALLSLRASGAPPPPPEGDGNRSLSKAEIADLNIQLLEAAKNGQSDEVQKLAAAGAKVNFWDPEMLQSTPLHWAACNGHVGTVEVLVKLGASVSPTNQHGWTALHHAANWGYVDCVKKLLDLGADPYSQSEGGHTPMEAAAFKGWDAVVSVFKERADVEFEDFFAAQEKADQPIAGFNPDMAKRVVRNVDDFSIWQDKWGAKG